MELLEEDKSSELQERFLQVIFSDIYKNISKLKISQRDKSIWHTVVFQYNHLLGSFFTRMAEVDPEQRTETKYKTKYKQRVTQSIVWPKFTMNKEKKTK